MSNATATKSAPPAVTVVPAVYRGRQGFEARLPTGGKILWRASEEQARADAEAWLARAWTGKR